MTLKGGRSSGEEKSRPSDLVHLKANRFGHHGGSGGKRAGGEIEEEKKKKRKMRRTPASQVLFTLPRRSPLRVGEGRLKKKRSGGTTRRLFLSSRLPADVRAGRKKRLQKKGEKGDPKAVIVLRGRVRERWKGEGGRKARGKEKEKEGWSDALFDALLFDRALANQRRMLRGGEGRRVEKEEGRGGGEPSGLRICHGCKSCPRRRRDRGKERKTPWKKSGGTVSTL